MNTKALITTLAVLGSTSSLAMANPAHDAAPLTVNARVSYNQAPASRDHRFTPPYIVAHPVAQPIVRPIVRPVVRPIIRPIVRPVIQPVVQVQSGWGWQPRPVVLADDLTYNAGEFRKDIVLEGQGRYNTVTLQEEAGCNFIKEVRIEFADGSVQSIPVNQNLVSSQAMTFDLDGSNRAINRIFVYRADGDYNAIRTASGGEFTVTAA
ncbi:MAG TPA: hypothetical protein VHW23_19190 [Kofleriaceae bacterium]|jgi:hypothetical protein|nr:hypothetical protein [Kofleriaceae bacterium]